MLSIKLIVVFLGLSLTLAQRPVPSPQMLLDHQGLEPQRDPRLSLNVDPLIANRPGFQRQRFHNNGQLGPYAASEILRSENENSGDGNFRWGFETSEGIKQDAMGYLKEARSQDEGPIQVIQGSYSYISPEGVPVNVQYIADELGFRIIGDNVSTPPGQPFRAVPNPAIDPLIRNRPLINDNEHFVQDLQNRNPGAYNPFRQPLARPGFGLDRQFNNNNRFSPFNNDPRYNPRFPQNQLASGAPLPSPAN